MEKRADVLWVDFIRVVATFCVVSLHSAYPPLYRYNAIPASSWWTSNIYDSIVRMGVPLFFMLSGFLLLDKTETMVEFFKKRMKKVVVPLIAWSLIYILWKVYYNRSETISYYSFYSILLTPAYYHLWFLYVIIGIYLYLPILRVFIRNADIKHLSYFTALWIFAVCLIPIAENVSSSTSKIDLKMISGFSGYLVLGYLIGKMDITKKWIILSILAFLIAAGMTAFGTFYLTRKSGAFVETLYNYKSPNVLLLSVSGFILLRAMAENVLFLNRKKSISIIKKLSSASLGIYLIHTMFLGLIGYNFFGYRFGVFHGSPIYVIPITAFLTFVLSFVFTTILRNIKYVRIIVP